MLVDDITWGRGAGAVLSCGLALLTTCGTARAVVISGREFTTPEGWQVELVASPPLVERPITGDFDESGRLYVAESSGSNAPVEQQLEDRPHRVLRLLDVDGDGKFDQSTVFADKLMFPEGTLWYRGSLFVSAPPTIWKLTDTDDDGVADQREEWFHGTLTPCANDLHGPYLGRDGWIYWCKGAFAEQHHQRPDGSTLDTRAAHIFRRRPEGGGIESVMTGGMDNPVDVVSTLGGERIFSTTFLQRPEHGKRDGLIHAVYGGVYGKIHGVIDEHPRTGDVLPPLVHLGPAAPCGLTLLESEQDDPRFRGSVVVAQFNRQRVSMHRLLVDGSTFTTQDRDLMVTEDRDFHPTDVLEDADGSVLVINTGGWYKLCCPSSNLWKPDVAGGIYRLRRTQATAQADPRGCQLDWTSVGATELATRLGDFRPAVVRRTIDELSQMGTPAIEAIGKVYDQSEKARTRAECVWAWTRITDAAARERVRRALADRDETVRQAALNSVSLHRDTAAAAAAQAILQDGTLMNRRLAAEVLGRLRQRLAIDSLLDSLSIPHDRMLHHAVTFALIEIDAPHETRQSLLGRRGAALAAGLLALDQMPHHDLRAEQVTAALTSSSPEVREAAWWIADRHRGDWSPQLAAVVTKMLEDVDHDLPVELTPVRLAGLSHEPALQNSLAPVLRDARFAARHAMIVNAMVLPDGASIPEAWVTVLAEQLQSASSAVPAQVVAAMRRLAREQMPVAWRDALETWTRRGAADATSRIQALDAITADHASLPSEQLSWVLPLLSPNTATGARSVAVALLKRVELNPEQQKELAGSLKEATLLDLRELLDGFRNTDARTKVGLLNSLRENSAAEGLHPDQLSSVLPDSVSPEVLAWVASIRQRQADVRNRIQRVAQLVATADARQGQRLYFSAKAACSACHALGYLGGRVGPDLSRIGDIRKEQDLLESIMLPSQSFVRSYEPVSVVTHAGQTYNGVVKDETRDTLVLTLDAEREVPLEKSDILERHPSSVSVMPAGLAEQWSDQQLADLVRFLQTAR